VTTSILDQEHPVNTTHNKEDEQSTTNLTKSEFWMRVAGVGFSLWALMIPIGISMIRAAADRLVDSQSALQVKMDTYILTTERRLTIIEANQQRLLEHDSDQTHRLELIELQQRRVDLKH
jgi:hypothetical protein